MASNEKTEKSTKDWAREDPEKAHNENLKLNISLWLICDASDVVRIGNKVCSASLFEFGSENPII